MKGVPARPITETQSLVYLLAQLWFSSKCFRIADDGAAIALHLLTFFYSVTNILFSNI